MRWLAGLMAIAALAGPAGAEVKVYLLDQPEPIVTAEVFEEGPWLFYREGESPYLLTIARNRVERLEIVRDGAVQTVQITPPGEAVFPDFRRQVFLSIAELLDKRVEELRKQYVDEVSKVATVATAERSGAPQASVEARAAAAIVAERAASLREEYEAARARLEVVLDRAASYRATAPKPRYYFYR